MCMCIDVRKKNEENESIFGNGKYQMLHTPIHLGPILLLFNINQASNHFPLSTNHNAYYRHRYYSCSSYLTLCNLLPDFFSNPFSGLKFITKVYFFSFGKYINISNRLGVYA